MGFILFLKKLVFELILTRNYLRSVSKSTKETFYGIRPLSLYCFASHRKSPNLRDKNFHQMFANWKLRMITITQMVFECWLKVLRMAIVTLSLDLS